MSLTRWAGSISALLLASAALAQQQQQQPVAGLAPSAAAAAPAPTDCFATYTSGAGATAFTFCVTANGNILRLEAPAGVEHIRNGVYMEGFAICDQTLGLRYWDLGGYSPNGTFLAPTITQPNGPNTFPLTITRSTWDNLYTLRQTYSRSPQERAVNITMSLVNNDITFTNPRTVWLWREADFDMNGSFSNWGGSTQDSGFAWNNVSGLSPIGNGGMLTSLSLAVPHTGGVTPFGIGDPACPDFRDSGWPRADDVVAWVGHQFNYTASHQTRTVSVQMRVF